VLDTSAGRPAAGIRVTLEDVGGGTWLGEGNTDEDGRVPQIGPDRLDAGDYLLRFATGEYFAARGTRAFYPEVVVVFTVSDPGQHYHVPLLLSPFGYSTYRGS
jgi:5-hydroxyisourate hydrolase